MDAKVNENMPRVGLPLDLPRKERDPEAEKFQLARNESDARGPDGQRQGPVRPQSQFFYADPNGAGGTGHGRTSGSGGSSGTSGTSGSGDTSGSGGTSGHGTGGLLGAGLGAGVGGGVGAAPGPSGTGHTTGTKQVEHTPKGGGETVKLKDFKPPGWEDAAGNPAACYKLACSGASQTAPAGQSVTGGGGVILYDDKTGLGSEIIKKPAQRIHTDKDASAVALEQIKRHIDDGRAVVAGVSEPANSTIVDGPRLEKGKEKEDSEPATDHFVAVYGYEIVNGKIVGRHFVNFVTVSMSSD
jgi:hypothetical protein